MRRYLHETRITSRQTLDPTRRLCSPCRNYPFRKPRFLRRHRSTMVAAKRALLDIHQWYCRSCNWNRRIDAQVSENWCSGFSCTICCGIPRQYFHGVGLARSINRRTGGVVGSLTVSVCIHLDGITCGQAKWLTNCQQHTSFPKTQVSHRGHLRGQSRRLSPRQTAPMGRIPGRD